MRRIGKWIAVGGVGALVVAGGAAVWLRLALGASLPRLTGEVRIGGLAAPVRIERDGLGVPTITAAKRIDVARATGFLHAQDRFFQMDLQRRAAAGELAALIGPAMVAEDRRVRVHRFRAVAERVLAAAGSAERAVVEAYAQGVNAGLADLGGRPFEYLALRSQPEPWRPIDTVLTLLAMFLTLHDPDATFDSQVGLLHELLPGPLAEFLDPPGTEWDAPIVGPAFATPPIPGPEVIDLRRAAAPAAWPHASQDPGGEPPPRLGSNNFALAGAHTRDGRPLLAGDMHLGLSVPNIWYRASFVWPRGDGATELHRVTGVTLPGTPSMVAGSNGDLAWAFTNAYGDFVDLVVVEADPADPERYLTPQGWRRFEHATELIQVKGADPDTLEITSTIWGPIVDHDQQGRPRALRWTAHDVEAVNLEHMRLEQAADLDAAFATAHRIGSPPQNLLVAEAAGRIGWTLLGRLPRRIGFDGRSPISWADGTRRWDGWVADAEVPAVIAPPDGRLWSANARVVDGEMLRTIGDGGYDLGSRAGQIRDALRGLEAAVPRDLLAIQLDDRALFQERWHDLLLAALTDAAVAADPHRAELRRFVEGWGGRAAIDSVGFRMVRAFRLTLAEQVFAPLVAPCKAADPRFDYRRMNQQEGPLWRLVTEQPPHLLDPKYRSWDDQILAAIDATLQNFLKDGSRLAAHTWGERNTARIQHPLSLAVPFLGRFLDMPAEPLPGDGDLPRAQGATYGASQRMVVSPGREKEGIFHMPCGQSGHPLSPHYRDGHAAWVRGEPTPFLPGPTVTTLVLVPGG